MKIASISPINQNIISNRRNLAKNAPIQSYAPYKTKNTTYPKNYYTVNFTSLFPKKKKPDMMKNIGTATSVKLEIQCVKNINS